MKLIQNYLTNNECYKKGVKIQVKGLMLHSTGANNPYLKRYVQPNIEGIGNVRKKELIKKEKVLVGFKEDEWKELK